MPSKNNDNKLNQGMERQIGGAPLDFKLKNMVINTKTTNEDAAQRSQKSVAAHNKQCGESAGYKEKAPQSERIGTSRIIMTRLLKSLSRNLYIPVGYRDSKPEGAGRHVRRRKVLHVLTLLCRT